MCNVMMVLMINKKDSKVLQIALMPSSIIMQSEPIFEKFQEQEQRTSASKVCCKLLCIHSTKAIALETEGGECYLFLISLELVVTRTVERGSTLHSDQALALAASTIAQQPPASFQATEAANFAFIYCFMPTFDRPALPRRANTSIIVWICEHENMKQ